MNTYFPRIGHVRPSHLMYTSGVGALIDLPNLAVLVRGLDEWDYNRVPELRTLTEPRLLAEVQGKLGRQVTELRTPPWVDESGSAQQDALNPVGVPVRVFPQWLRCTYCNVLAPLDPGGNLWRFDNSNPHRPDLARFAHSLCAKKGKPPLAVAARFVLACTAGHLDDFPYREFVHRGDECPVPGGLLQMKDFGGQSGPNVTIRCLACDVRPRNMMDAVGDRARGTLPKCRGRHPQLSTFDTGGCSADVKTLVVGASNQWFADLRSIIAVPSSASTALAGEVSRLWADLHDIPSREVLVYALARNTSLHSLRNQDPDKVMTAVEGYRREQSSDSKPESSDIKAPEWKAFTAPTTAETSPDFAVERLNVHHELRPLFAEVVQVQRLREVKAFLGFTRIDAPDAEDPDATARAPISRDHRPTWVPASEVRGEGIFLRLQEELIAVWEERVSGTTTDQAHRQAYIRFRRNRNSGRDPAFEPWRGWPGLRYIALHTLSHLLIRRIALECGYSSASLAERIYSSYRDEERAGILLYTAAPDSEGTLGGLAALAEPETLHRIVRGALDDARRCSSDPVCAERLPKDPEEFLHGAACHVCLFVSETTCERGNRFLDRRFLVDLGNPSLVLTPAGI